MGVETMSDPVSDEAVSSGTLHVRADRARRLVDLVAELVIAQTMLFDEELLAGRDAAELRHKAHAAGHIARSLYDAAVRLHMARLETTLAEVAGVARGVMLRVGREVELDVSGGETEVDRDTAELLVDPLSRLVSIAIEHGIEPPEERARLGKAPRGTLRVTATLSGSSTTIEVTHDGRPIDTDALAARAIKRGLLEPGHRGSRQAVLMMVFAAGMSDRDRTGQVAGCGSGLAEVRKTVEALNGTIEVTSDEHTGTRFSLRLPLASAMLDGLVVGSGGHRYVLPRSDVVRVSQRLAPGPHPLDGANELFPDHEGHAPLIPIARLVGGAQHRDARAVVVVRAGTHRFALLVDELLGQQQVVLRSLGALSGAAIVRGAAIMTNGQIGLVLDPSALLIDFAAGSRAWAGTMGRTSEAAGKYLRTTPKLDVADAAPEQDIVVQVALLSVSARVEIRVALAVGSASASTLARHLFGDADDDLAREVVSELANIYMGTIKTDLAKEGLVFAAGVPELSSELPAPAVFRHWQEGALHVGGAVVHARIGMRPRALRSVVPSQLEEGMVTVRDVLDARGAPIVDGSTRLSASMIATVRERASPMRAIDVILP